jgi:hypothetical protein
MDDKEILLAIQELVDQIAMIVERAGYPIRTFGEMGPADIALRDRPKGSGQD